MSGWRSPKREHWSHPQIKWCQQSMLTSAPMWAREKQQASQQTSCMRVLKALTCKPAQHDHERTQHLQMGPFPCERSSKSRHLRLGVRALSMRP